MAARNTPRSSRQATAPAQEAKAAPGGGTEPKVPAASAQPTEGDGKRTEELLTTGDMARLSNNTLRTVRFYEEEEILKPAKRSEGGHRLFPRTELDRLLLVSELREAGLSLDEIKDVLTMKESGSTARVAGERALGMIRAHVRALDAKLEVLARLRQDLVTTSELLAVCAQCTDGNFPSNCQNCSTIDANRVPLPMRVVWGVAGDASGEEKRHLPTAGDGPEAKGGKPAVGTT